MGRLRILASIRNCPYYNALYVLALQSASNIASALNETSDSSRWQQRAEAVSQAINGHLWDSAVGAYVDEMGTSRHGQDGNGIAVIAGVANYTRAESALSYLANNTALFYGNAFMDDDSLVAEGSQRVYAFISYFDIHARFLIGETNSAMDEIRRLYGYMLNSDPGITFWEGIGRNGSAYEQGFTSKAHGWSTGVLPALTNHVLGLTPTGPGYQTFSIKPVFPQNITWARGQEATPYGDIYVQWVSEDETQTVFFMSSEGTSANVTVPKASSVLFDGSIVWSSADRIKSSVQIEVNDKSVTLISVPQGNHTIISK